MWVEALARRPALLVLAFAALQVLVWTVVPLLANHSYPIDVIEGLAWGQEWQLGYHKHPPVVSWILDAFYETVGPSGPYLLSQLCIAATYLCVFSLGRRIMDAGRAAVGTLLLAGVFYFSWPTPEFNHNVAQMPLWAAAILIFHHALSSERPGWWPALGALFGLGLMIKYSVVVLLAVMGLFVLAMPRHRRLLLRRPLWIGLATMVVVASPHLLWLATHDFMTLGYLKMRTATSAAQGGRPWWQPLTFVASQAADHLPMLGLLAAAGLVGRRDPAAGDPSARPEDRWFLHAMGLGPFLLTVLVSLVGSADTHDMWGAPMWTLSGLVAVDLLWRRWPRLAPRRLAAGVLGLLVVVPLTYAATSGLSTWLTGRPHRTSWPEHAVAAEAAAAWAGQTACPLRLVAGETWLAGLVSAHATGRPSVLINGDLRISPWVSDARLGREGALLLWTVKPESDPSRLPDQLAALPGASAKGVLSLPWPNGGKAAPLQIGWGMVPPACGT